MGSLLIVTGPPGAGKSTAAALLAERYDPSALVEGDVFHAFLRCGAIEPWLPVDACVERVATRAGHRFTDESATRSMHAQFDSHRPADRHVIAGDEFGAGEIVEQIVARRTAGLLRVSSHDLGAP